MHAGLLCVWVNAMNACGVAVCVGQCNECMWGCCVWVNAMNACGVAVCVGQCNECMWGCCVCGSIQ